MVTDVSKEKEAGVLLMVAVGDRDTYVDHNKALLSLVVLCRWKDTANPFRVNETTKLTCIPTLVNWTTVRHNTTLIIALMSLLLQGKRLLEEECAKKELVQSLFGV